MAKGVTIDLIVDPKGAVEGISTASGSAEGLGSVLSTVGNLGVAAFAAATTAVVAAAGALTAATVSAAAYADEILTTATNTNISADALQAYKYAAEQIDVSFETFVASNGKLIKSMQAAREGTGPAAEAFKALGLSVTDSAGNLVDSEQLYWDAIDALGGVANETERTALAQQIFGKSAAELNSIIATGSDGFAELTAQAQANGAIMSGEQLAALGAFDDKMQQLTATVDATKNALGLTLLPILDSLAGEGAGALGEFTNALLDADGDLSKAAPAFEEFATKIAAALFDAIPKILEVGISIVSGLVQGIVSQAPTLIKTAIPLIVSFATGILSMLPAILDAGLKVLIALVQGISASLPVLIPAAVDAILGLVSALIDNLPMILEAGLQLVLGLALGIVDAIPQLIAALPELINALLSGLLGAIPQLVMAGVKLIVALVENLPAIIEGIISIVPAIVDAIVKTFGDPKFWKQMGEAGMQLIRGLWEGIKGMGDWLWRQIKKFFGEVIDNIKKLFGIRSPSTVFAGFGEYMIEGLEKGLTGPNNLKPIMSDLSSQVTKGFQGSLAADVRATVATNTQANVAAASSNGGLSVDPEMRTLMRTLISAVDHIEPGRIFPEEVARTTHVGDSRLAAIGAS